MGSIATKFDLANDLTIITAVGKMKPIDFQEWTDSYYNNRVTRLALWDLTQADLSEIKAEDLRNDAARTKALADARRGGKTAIVSGNNLAYGLSRMLEVFYDLEDIPFDVQVFRNIEDAQVWLGVCKD